jgi:acyl carrier protein
LSGELKPDVATERENSMANTNSLSVTAAPSAAVIQEWLLANLSKSLNLGPAEIDPREPFASYGLSSVASVSLTADLEDWLELELSPTLAWDYPSIELLAQHLSEEIKRQEISAAVSQ